MRPFLLASAVAFLLAGCADTAPTAPATVEQVPQFGLLDAPRPEGMLRFDAEPYNATVAYTVEFAAQTVPCVFGGITGCQNPEALIDLTPQVPSDAPVELTVRMESTACAFANLEVDGTTLQRYESTADGTSASIAASLLREPSGTVGLLVYDCRFFALDVESGMAPMAVSIEARSVVRPDVVPTYLPVAVELAPQDLLRASGSGLDALFVVGPDGVGHEVVAPFEVNVTMQGRHMVLAVGTGDVTLQGVNGTLEALTLQLQQGDRRPLSSNQVQEWDFTVPGIPVFVAVALAPAAPPADAFVLDGNTHVSVTADGVDIVSYDEAYPIPSFSGGAGGLRVFGSSFADPRLVAGTFHASVLQEATLHQEAFDYAVYVDF